MKNRSRLKVLSYLLFVTVLLVVCFLSASPAAAVPGGGPATITGIWILDKANNTLQEKNNRSTLHIGEQMPLRVMASWAIPYIGDVTTNATLTVNDPTLGDIDSKGVFAAKKPGKVTIEAVIRVVTSLGSDKVLGLTGKVPIGKPVTEFRSQIELIIAN